MGREMVVALHARAVWEVPPHFVQHTAEGRGGVSAPLQGKEGQAAEASKQAVPHLGQNIVEEEGNLREQRAEQQEQQMRRDRGPAGGKTGPPHTHTHPRSVWHTIKALCFAHTRPRSHPSSLSFCGRGYLF